LVPIFSHKQILSVRDGSSLFNRPRYDARASQSLISTRALENRVVMSYSGDVDFDLFGFGVLAVAAD
jgi:hypothetical protein